MTERPPLGLMPKRLWEEQRMGEIAAAVARYREAGMDVPMEWMLEYSELYWTLQMSGGS